MNQSFFENIQFRIRIRKQKRETNAMFSSNLIISLTFKGLYLMSFLYIVSLRRPSVTFKAVVGNCNSVQPEMITLCYKTSLPTLLSQYKLEDIYNTDEFGLFYQCLPNKTFHLKSDKCSGGKYSKIRFIVLAAANAVGSNVCDWKI